MKEVGKESDELLGWLWVVVGGGFYISGDIV